MTQERNARARIVGEERPLTARSVVASVLLGTSPPELSGQRLVRTAELFGLSDGATRVALSRMVASGELETDDGRYRLAGPLLARRDRQDRSRHPTPQQWSGVWLIAVAAATGGRPASARVETRKAMAQAHMGGWREGVWARPDNLGVAQTRPEVGCSWFVARPVEEGGDALLADALWDLDGWAAKAEHLRREMATSIGALEARRTQVLAACFVTAAAVVRHLQADPLLPAVLLGPRWPGAVLRAEYDLYEAAYQGVLRTVLRGLER